MFDPEKFGEAMGEAIREAVAPLLKRIGELEAKVENELSEVAADVLDCVKTLHELPEARDGKDGANGPDGQPGKDGERGADGERGEDGKSVTVEDVAPVLEMAVNKWALEFERRAHDTLQKAIDRIPVPKDGINGVDGKDGRDGIGFDDLQVEFDGQKTVTFKLQREDVTKEFNLTLPVVVDRGIFKELQPYQSGDGVTWGGSYWIAQKDAPVGKPGEAGSDGWRLAVKKGRDGKDGRNGIDKTLPVAL